MAATTAVTPTRRLDGIEHTGDIGVLQRLLEVLEAPDPQFAIVTP